MKKSGFGPATLWLTILCFKISLFGCMLLLNMPLTFCMDMRELTDEEKKARLELYIQFFDAIEKGDYHTVIQLLQEGIDPNSSSGDNTTLMLAAMYRYNSILMALLDHGADPNLTNDDGETALMVAALLGRTEAVLTLLQHNAHPNLRDKNGSTALEKALKECEPFETCKAIIIMLLRYGASYNNREYARHVQNALAQYISNSLVAPLVLNDIENLRAQLRRIPAEVIEEDRIRQYCHIYGCQPPLLEKVIRALKNAYAQAFGSGSSARENYPHINQPDEEGWTPLHWAAAQGNHRAVILLLQHGANPFAVTHEGLTSVQIAERNSHNTTSTIEHNRYQKIITTILKGRMITLDKILGAITAQTGFTTVDLPPEIREQIAEMIRKSLTQPPERGRQHTFGHGDPGSSSGR